MPYIKKKKCPLCRSLYGREEIGEEEFESLVNRQNAVYHDDGVDEIVVIPTACGCEGGHHVEYIAASCNEPS